MNILNYGAIDNKYTRWYLNICKNAMSRANNKKDAALLLGYVEGHHIIPKCIYKNNNIVYLTMREHFIVHWPLTKMFNSTIKYKMLHALTFMSQGRNLSSKQIEVCKKARNQPCTKERAQSISNARKNTIKHECIFCKKLVDPGNFSRFHGDKCKFNPNIDKNILQERSLNAKKNYENQVKNGTFNCIKPIHGNFTCPYCNKVGTNFGSMKQFHFENCFIVNPISKCSCILCKKEVQPKNLLRHRCQ